MSKIEDLYKKKQRLALERDMCAEFYNLMLSKANQNVDSPEHYDYYLDLVEMMEPFAKEVKQSIREVNKQICEICEVPPSWFYWRFRKSSKAMSYSGK